MCESCTSIPGNSSVPFICKDCHYDTVGQLITVFLMGYWTFSLFERPSNHAFKKKENLLSNPFCLHFLAFIRLKLTSISPKLSKFDLLNHPKLYFGFATDQGSLFLWTFLAGRWCTQFPCCSPPRTWSASSSRWRPTPTSTTSILATANQQWAPTSLRPLSRAAALNPSRQTRALTPALVPPARWFQQVWF